MVELTDQLPPFYRLYLQEKERARVLEKALRGLMDNEHIDLGDQIYVVREREGLGWDGPSVKKWSDAITAAKDVLKTQSAIEAALSADLKLEAKP